MANKTNTARHREYLNSIKNMTDHDKKAAPNIILIVMDDLGAGDLSCYGSKVINTPNIDNMAQRGAMLKNFYASSPVCTPSRYSIMTGRYPCRASIKGVFRPTVDVEGKYITAPGYEDTGTEIDGQPTKRYIAQVKSFNKIMRDKGIVSGIPEDEITIAEILQARGYRTGMFGKWHLGDKSPHLPNDKGFDYFYGAHYSNDMVPYHFWRNRDIAIEAPFDQSFITEYLNKELFEFIEKNSEVPFFAYYASPWPHHPLNCGKSFKCSSRGGTYGDCIEEFDHGVGQLFEILKSKNILENTMIIFTSDNGPWHQGSTGGHRGRKGNCFDGGQLVPAIFYWEDHIRSSEIDAQSMNIDFFPTICEIAGLQLPHDRVIDGKSLMSLLDGKKTESPHDHLVYINSLIDVSKGQGYAVRSKDDFKYYKNAPSENSVYKDMKIHSFLFDLSIDKDESYDVKMDYPKKYNYLKIYLDNFNKNITKNPRGWEIEGVDLTIN